MTFKTLRKAVFSLHRYVGLLVGLLLIVIGLTGSLLVFEPEINDWLTMRQFGQVTQQTQPLTPEQLLNLAKVNYPTLKPVGLYLPDRLDRPVKLRMELPQTNPKVYLDGSYEVFLNPYSGAVLGDRNERFSYYRFLLNLHYRLFAEDIGIAVVGIAGFLLLLLSLSGLVLWPGWRKLIAGFKINWNAHPKRLNFDLHKVVGVIAVVFLVLTAFTGFCWNFYEFTQPVIYTLTATPTLPDPQSKPIVGKLPLSLTELLAKAEAAFPEGRLTSVNLPDKPEDALSVYKQIGDGIAYANVVYLDQFSGQIIRIDDERKAPLGDRVLNSFTPLHYGTFGGLPTRILYVFVGLSPLILFITGFVMWWYRKRKKTIRDDSQLIQQD
ncbi:PepSY-associated TM helix domain-containing protein [Phormidesmis priestleyi]